MLSFFIFDSVYNGEGNGNLLQYSCLENPMDRGAWWATVPGVARVRHELATKPLRERSLTPLRVVYGSFLAVTAVVALL